MLKVSKESLEDVKTYLELSYTPEWVEIENYLELQGREIESLVVKWSDGNQVHCKECNRNLDEIITWIIEENAMNIKEIDRLIKEYANKKNGQEAVELLQLYKDRPKQLLNFLDTSLQEERAGDQVLETLYMDLLHLLK